MDSETHAKTADRGRSIEGLLLFVARSLADHPDEVEVQFVSDEEGEVFEIRARASDLGRLIGKGGQTAKALQAIMNVGGGGRRYHLDIVELDDAV